MGSVESLLGRRPLLQWFCTTSPEVLNPAGRPSPSQKQFLALCRCQGQPCFHIGGARPHSSAAGRSSTFLQPKLGSRPHPAGSGNHLGQAGRSGVEDRGHRGAAASVSLEMVSVCLSRGAAHLHPRALGQVSSAILAPQPRAPLSMVLKPKPEPPVSSAFFSLFPPRVGHRRGHDGSPHPTLLPPWLPGLVSILSGRSP